MLKIRIKHIVVTYIFINIYIYIYLKIHKLVNDKTKENKFAFELG